jgi:hypothetical protein
MPAANQSAKSSRLAASTPNNFLSEDEIVLDRMRSFHRQRVEAIRNKEKPFVLGEGGKLIVHLIPVGTVWSPKRFTASELKEHGQNLNPLGKRGGDPRFNVDGFVILDGRSELRSYTQLYRDGRLEAAMSDASFQKDGVHFFRDTICEMALIQVVGQYIACCKGLGVRPPLWLFTTLADVEGVHIYTHGGDEECAFDRPVVQLPETEIAAFEIELHFLTFV